MSVAPAGDAPRLVVLSALFPSPVQPHAGLFVRERMYRVAAHLPLTVVAPQPWFPGQGLLRRFRPHWRVPAPRHEIDRGVEVFRPRFLSFPSVFKSLDGVLMALGVLPTLRTLKRAGRLDVLDAHFAYPDGVAAVWLGRWLNCPVTVTLRGTEVRHVGDPTLLRQLVRVFRKADRIIGVSDSLRRLAVRHGADPGCTTVVGNGVDTVRFRAIDRRSARQALGLPLDAPVLIGVGGLTERKGFHRVLDQLPRLRARYPTLQYLIVGGESAEGDWRARLQAQVDELGLSDGVHFCGAVAPDALHRYLSAADVFVLATRNEGWANVFLEAMACGLPVVTTDVGGNREVVVHDELGTVVPFGDAEALGAAIGEALARPWDRSAIVAHAQANDWDERVVRLLALFRELHARPEPYAAAPVTVEVRNG